MSTVLVDRDGNELDLPTRTPDGKDIVYVEPSSYQPTKEEMEEVIELPEDVTPEDLAAAIFRPMKVVTLPGARNLRKVKKRDQIR